MLPCNYNRIEMYIRFDFSVKYLYCKNMMETIVLMSLLNYFKPKKLVRYP